MKIYALCFLSIIITCNGQAQELNKSYKRLPATALWPGQKIDQKEIEESIKKAGIFKDVTQAVIIPFLPTKETANGTSILVCPGGGYSALAWLHHVENLAPFFTSKGITVIGLSYRTAHKQNKIPEDPLKDFKQAISLIRKNAAEWNLDSDKIVGLGFSAGANLLLQYACSPEGEKIKYLNFLCLWPFFKKADDYTIQRKNLEIILFTAEEDKVAPAAFSMDMAQNFEKAGNKTTLIKYKEGSHMAFNFAQDGPQIDWTKDFIKWLEEKKLPEK